jgi:hemerythrin superfamily protein
MLNTIKYYANLLNNSKFFAGIVMIMLNIGSKYITIKLSKSQELYLRNTIARQLLIFSIIWMGTRDVLISLIMTAVFKVLTEHLFNEESSLCIIPHSMRKYEELLDDDKNGHITPEEVENATRILEKVKKRERRRNHLRQLENFRSKLVY